jgi:hypothetical protein
MMPEPDMKPLEEKRMKALEKGRWQPRTHYLWWDEAESLEDVHRRFAAMVEEGSARETDDYVILHWQR